MAMTDKQQQRLENLEQMVMIMAGMLRQYSPPDGQRELETLMKQFGNGCVNLGSEAPNHPGEIRHTPRDYKPELILPR